MDPQYAHLPVVKYDSIVYAKPPYNMTDGVPEELLPQIQVETGYHRLENAPRAATYELSEAIGLRKVPCPWCGWKPEDRFAGREIMLAVEGDTTGVRIRQPFPCRCRFYEKIFTRWSGPHAMVPYGYQKFRLSTLKPSEKSRVPLEDQQDLIDQIAADPKRNYLFVGPGGTGKTVFTTALFGKALDNWAEKVWDKIGMVDACWMVVTADYLQQEHDYIRERERKIVDADGNESYSTAKEPIVTRQKIKEARSMDLTPCLVLEEIDKIPDLTKFRSSNLFGLINEVYQQEGQIIVSSNLDIDGLKKLFGEANGDPLTRRFTKDGDGVVINLNDYELRQRN